MSMTLLNRIRNLLRENTDYKGEHTSPGPGSGAPLHDVSEVFPSDIHSHDAVRLYGTGAPYDRESISTIQQHKDKPNSIVTIHRAVPKVTSKADELKTHEKHMNAYMRSGKTPEGKSGAEGSEWYDRAWDKRAELQDAPEEPAAKKHTINKGDWVTTSKAYAKDHGEHALNGKYQIISKKVKASDLYTSGDSIHEWGYHPKEGK